MKDILGNDLYFYMYMFVVSFSEPFTSTSTSTDFNRAFENLPWYINGGDSVGALITHSTSPEVKVTIEIQFFTGRGNYSSLITEICV